MIGDDYDEAAFSCRLDTTRDLVTLLSCLSHGTKKDQHAFCEVRTRIIFSSSSEGYWL